MSRAALTQITRIDIQFGAWYERMQAGVEMIVFSPRSATEIEALGIHDRTLDIHGHTATMLSAGTTSTCPEDRMRRYPLTIRMLAASLAAASVTRNSRRKLEARIS